MVKVGKSKLYLFEDDGKVKLEDADRSRGFEAEFTGYIVPQWHIYGGYSYIDAKVLNDFNADLNGKRKENTSKNSVNIWTRYNFSNIKALKNFGVGLRMLYQS